MHPLTPEQVCDAEYRAAKSPYIGGPCGSRCEGSCGPGLCQVRPPSSHKSAGQPAGSPAVQARGGTLKRLHKIDNHYAWLAVSLHLQPVRGCA